MRPIGSTSESDTEFDRMKQVGIKVLYLQKGLCSSVPVLWTHVRLVALQEILDEVVRELHKVKDEIINGKQSSTALCGEHNR